MQIHEISQPTTLNEIDLVGPSSIFNVGREALKDKSWIDSKALGAAQQRAADKFGKSYAPALAKAAHANIAPLAKQLAQGWKAIGSQLPAPVASPTTVPGTATKAFAQQPAGYKAITTNQPAGIPGAQYKPPVQPTSGAVKTQPTVVQKRPVIAKQAQPVNEDAAGDYRTEFINYAHKTLGARGVDTQAIAKDTNTNLELNRAVDRIIATYQKPTEQQAAVEQYFTTALTKWNELQQDPVKYNKAFPGGQNLGSRSSVAMPAGSVEQEIKDTLAKLGITGPQLSGLGKVAAEANKGSVEVKSTGNPVWDAILKSAGMHLR